MIDKLFRGYWWLPGGSINDSVGGTLEVAEGKPLVLLLMGSLYDEPDLLSRRIEERILGFTEDGRNVTVLQATGHTGFRTRDVTLYSQRWVSQAAILGAHLSSEADTRFRYVDVELDVLSELARSGLDRRGTSEDSREWTWQRPPILSARSRDLAISLAVAPHGGLVDQLTHELRFWAVPRFRLCSDEPMDLGVIIDDVLYAVVDLCSLMAGRPSTIERVVLHPEGAAPSPRRFSGSELQLMFNPSRRSADIARQAAFLTTFFDSPIAFAELLPAWMTLWSNSELRPLLDRYFLQDARPSAFPETTFLGLAVFLEGFHKAMVNGGESSFGARLMDLFSAARVVLDATNSNPHRVCEVIRDTRNTQAHGRRRPGDRSVEGWQVGALNHLMDLVVRSLLLGRLGFSGTQIGDLLQLVCLQVRRESERAVWAVGEPSPS